MFFLERLRAIKLGFFDARALGKTAKNLKFFNENINLLCHG